MTNRTEWQQADPKFGTERELERQSSLIRAINEASPDGILVVDEEGVIVTHNHRFVEIWQLPNDCLQGPQPGSAIGEPDDPILTTVRGRVKDPQAFLARVKELYENPDLTDHCEIELLDGRTVERHSTVLRADDGRFLGRVWFFRDITSHKQAEAALMELTRQDALTGVANRRYFFDRAGQELARSRRHGAPLCIAELDIDFFKQINDRHGHAVGDKVLKSISEICQRLLREEDLFARIGGEEFAVLLPDTRMEGARLQAERLREEVARSTVAGAGVDVSCTVSIGVASLRASDTCAEDCLLRADRAMYRAKASGRNRVEIEP